MQRRKGATGERELCRLLAEYLGEPVARSLTQTRDGGQGGDINLAGRWAVEVKRGAKSALRCWWEQAVEQAGQEFVPVLAYRLDRMPWRVRVPLAVLAPEMFSALDAEWTAEISLPAFATLVRESL